MRTFLILLLLGFPILFAQEQPAERDTGEDRAQAIARDIEREVASLRGLEFRTPTKVGLYSKDQLIAFVQKSMSEEYAPELLASYERGLKAMGLVPAEYNFSTGMMALLVEQIGGFYDPEGKELRLIDDQPALAGMDGKTKALMEQVVMAHELTHALQDQHFDLETLPLDPDRDDDLVNAIRCLVEGDATVAMMGWVLGREDENLDVGRVFAMGPLLMMALRASGSAATALPGMNMENLKKAPAYLRESLSAPYIEGAGFCIKVGAKGRNFAGVDAAYRDLPVSTEQILHPEKALGEGRDHPQLVTLPDLASGLGEGWTRVASNNLGELGIRVLLMECPHGEAPGKRASRKAAEGWDGDRYEVYGRQGSPDVSAWYTVWDTDEDAGEFQDAIGAWVGTQVAEPKIESVDWVSTLLRRPDGTIDVVGRRGRAVVLLRRVGEEQAPLLLRSLFEQATLKEIRSVVRKEKDA